MPSTVIRHFRYVPEEHILSVTFVSGRRYHYHDVPEKLAEGMRNAFSKGEYFNAHIRDNFDFTREDG